MVFIEDVSRVEVNAGCRAQCHHCHYQSDGNPLPLKTVISALSSIQTSLVVLTGGEPLEHPEFREIANHANTIVPGLFRIASGGHVPIAPFLPQLVRSRRFCGFSLGTDILMSHRRCNDAFLPVWLSNSRLLEDWGIPYSLNFTLPTEDLSEVLLHLFQHHPNPSFVSISAMRTAGVRGELSSMKSEIDAIQLALAGITVYERIEMVDVRYP